MQIPQVQEFLVLYNFSIPILRVRSLWWPKEMKVGRHISSDQFGPPSPASLSSIWNRSCAVHFLALTVSAVSFMQIPQVQEFLVLYNFSIPILRVRSLWWPKEMKVGRHISRTGRRSKNQLLAVFQDLAKLHICLQVPEECHSGSKSQMAGYLKSEEVNTRIKRLRSHCDSFAAAGSTLTR
uniref:Uncharacterized protein n=1 Tax=Populus davidiana TaxID=266767 RepID=A0A6M2EZE8_9ROSI